LEYEDYLQKHWMHKVLVFIPAVSVQAAQNNILSCNYVLIKLYVSRCFVSSALNLGCRTGKHLRQMLRGKLRINFICRTATASNPKFISAAEQMQICFSSRAAYCALNFSCGVVNSIQLVSAVLRHVKLLPSAFEQLTSSETLSNEQLYFEKDKNQTAP
jgi:hypothetical protein